MDALHLDRSQLYRYQEMDRSKYNLVIGGMLVYGFFVDALICYFFGDILNYVLDSGPVMIGFFVTNIVCVILSVVLSSSPNAVVNFIGYNLMVLPIGLMLGMVVSAVSWALPWALPLRWSWCFSCGALARSLRTILLSPSSPSIWALTGSGPTG